MIIVRGEVVVVVVPVALSRLLLLLFVAAAAPCDNYAYYAEDDAPLFAFITTSSSPSRPRRRRWSSLPLYSSSSSSSSSVQQQREEDHDYAECYYARARQVRIEQGAEAAQPLYESILRRQYDDENESSSSNNYDDYDDYYKNNNIDVTIATRLAASKKAQSKLETIFCGDIQDEKQKLKLKTLRSTLLNNGYTTTNIAERMNVPEHMRYARAPIYVTPVSADGSRRTSWPWAAAGSKNGDNNPTALDLFIALFLIGLAVPKSLLEDSILLSKQQQQRPKGDIDNDDHDHDGESSAAAVIIMDILREYFLTECEHDPNLVFSLVSIVPIDLSSLPQSPQSPQSSPSESSSSAATTTNPGTNKNTLLLVTDWHPRVLSQTTIVNKTKNNYQEDSVMYIGPDSLALIQHWLTLLFPLNNRNKNSINNNDCIIPPSTILDVCTGSGVQALAAVRMIQQKQKQQKQKQIQQLDTDDNETTTTDDDDNGIVHAVCLDVNPRALRFTSFNAALNGIENYITCVKGDLITGYGSRYISSSNNNNVAGEEPLPKLLQDIISPYRHTGQQQQRYGYDLITANPPFLPVPPTLRQARHGLFSDGGSSGEVVLQATVQFASEILSPKGYLAVVSEFFLQNDDDDKDEDAAQPLIRRIQSWWGTSSSSSSSTTPSLSLPPSSSSYRGLLFTNEYPIDAATYSERRSDSFKEFETWQTHLQSYNITQCSPGLLYMQKLNNKNIMRHVIVPKSEWGSIWTPSNPFAVKFTQDSCRGFFSDDDVDGDDDIETQ